MTCTDAVSIGLDLGTSGVRGVAVDSGGEVLASAHAGLSAAVVVDHGGRHEQAPQAWWDICSGVLRQVMQTLRDLGVVPQALRGLAIDGTSGTLVCVDRDGVPLRPALMYNDTRAQREASELTELAGAFCQKLGYRFAASYALARIAWLRRHEPDVFARTATFQHQADHIVSRLCGCVTATDYSNALKTGYDLVDGRWPQWLSQLDGVRERLPPVVAPGERIGEVSLQSAQDTGLPAGLPVLGGATDGTAACLASGVRRVGDYNTTLGTTLVFKAVSNDLVRHAQGLIYSHKLPGGRWLPGAASNTGAEWTGRWFAAADAARLDTAADRLPPVLALAYPLVRDGERFPFLAPEATGLRPASTLSESERFAACLQGTALVERLAYDVIDAAAGFSGGDVYTTGGASRSDVWTQIRADATGRTFHRPVNPDSAFGSAVLAAAGTIHGSVWQAVAHMVRVQVSFVPRPQYGDFYARLFDDFRHHLRRNGWL